MAWGGALERFKKDTIAKKNGEKTNPERVGFWFASDALRGDRVRLEGSERRWADPSGQGQRDEAASLWSK
ncbi:hypothetical protein ROR02_21070 [Pararhodospirillum oryzae]|uniref:Uncharacterized protein n=1 Tax=Pararhodospirillum oryzae TaxID=478448 RepID=A0A512H939_9PROT|nr:hypothetical protein ROR02_21070 [Pararhodospirillum oryzae]